MQPCILKTLPAADVLAAAKTAIDINPMNAAPVEQFMAMAATALSVETVEPILGPQHLAVLTGKMWSPKGVTLEVAFFERINDALANKILLYLNNWRTKGHANVKFVRTSNLRNAPVRCTLAGNIYAAFLGVDCLSVDVNEPTLFLGGFGINTPEPEWSRVVEHEGGHLIGLPHEQFLPEIQDLLDDEKVIAWMMRTTGWSRQQVISQVLQTLRPGTYRATRGDPRGVMMYPFPAFVTTNGQPIPGGHGINAQDADFIATVYPLEVKPDDPPTPPTPPTGERMTLDKLKAILAAVVAFVTPFKDLSVIGTAIAFVLGVVNWALANEWVLNAVVWLINSGLIKFSQTELEAMQAFPADGAAKVAACVNDPESRAKLANAFATLAKGEMPK